MKVFEFIGYTIQCQQKHTPKKNNQAQINPVQLPARWTIQMGSTIRKTKITQKEMSWTFICIFRFHGFYIPLNRIAIFKVPIKIVANLLSLDKMQLCTYSIRYCTDLAILYGSSSMGTTKCCFVSLISFFRLRWLFDMYKVFDLFPLNKSTWAVRLQLRRTFTNFIFLSFSYLQFSFLLFVFANWLGCICNLLAKRQFGFPNTTWILVRV